jgi:hypothetical protein
MLWQAFSAYVAFVETDLGRVVAVVLCLAVIGMAVLWARRRVWWERWPLLIAAGVLTLVVVAIYAVAVGSGWWVGSFVWHTPPVVQAALLVPVTLVGWLAWFAGYSWLAAHTRHPVLIYTALALLLLPVVVLADLANISRGLIQISDDGQTWKNAVAGVGLVMAPIVVFEGLRRGLQLDALP